MMISSARAVPLSGSSEQLVTGPGMYAGLAVLETGGAQPATVRIYNGTSSAGVLVDAVDLAAGASASRAYDRATWCDQGIWVELGGAGAVAGSVRLA